MKPRICVCCGEPMVNHGNELSRNPNVCASCSSMADGIEGMNLPLDTPSEDSKITLPEPVEATHPAESTPLTPVVAA